LRCGELVLSITSELELMLPEVCLPMPSVKTGCATVGKDSTPTLSPRQVACLRLVAGGKTTLEIGAELGISNRTVEQYVAEACARLGVRTRIEAIVKTIRLGLISDEPSVI